MRTTSLSLALALLVSCSEDATPPELIGPVNASEAPAPPTPDERRALIEEVEQAIEDGRFSDARTMLGEVLPGDPDDGALLTLACEAAVMDGDHEAGVALGKRAVEALPDSSDAHLQYSRALGISMQEAGMLSAMGSIGTYKSALKRARELAPDAVEPRMDEVLFNLVAPGIIGGSTSRARDLAEELVELDPTQGMPLLVWAMSENDEVEEAIELCRDTLETAPDTPRIHVTLGGLLAENDREEEALEVYQEALQREKDRDYYDALYQLARLRIRKELDPGLAIPLLEEYAKDAPNHRELPSHAAAWWRIGNARELIGEEEGARTAYRKSLELDPDFERASDALEDLD